MKALVSVIIPVYNGELYLAEAIHSVLAQTVQPMEILVIDDGSTDETAPVALRFGDAVRYVHQANEGAAAARNRGVSLAQGEWIAFLDADDLWAPHKLARQLAACERAAHTDLVFGHIRYFISPDIPPAARPLHCPPEPLPGMLPSTMLARRETFEQVGLFETTWRVGEFVSWCARARDMGIKELMLPEVVAARRLHARNQGVTRRDAVEDYLHIVKAARDRRRQQRGA